jgi:hypothetical protein
MEEIGKLPGFPKLPTVQNLSCVSHRKISAMTRSYKNRVRSNLRDHPDQP